MAFRGGTEEAIDGQFDDDTFVGGLTDPFPVVVTPSGELHIDLAASGLPECPRNCCLQFSKCTRRGQR